jgi:hypothetical protein
MHVRLSALATRRCVDLLAPFDRPQWASSHWTRPLCGTRRRRRPRPLQPPRAQAAARRPPPRSRPPQAQGRARRRGGRRRARPRGRPPPVSRRCPRRSGARCRRASAPPRPRKRAARGRPRASPASQPRPGRRRCAPRLWRAAAGPAVEAAARSHGPPSASRRRWRAAGCAGRPATAGRRASAASPRAAARPRHPRRPRWRRMAAARRARRASSRRRRTPRRVGLPWFPLTAQPFQPSFPLRPWPAWDEPRACPSRLISAAHPSPPQAVSLNSAELFAHLPQYKRVDVTALLKMHPATTAMHPAILQVGRGRCVLKGCHITSLKLRSGHAPSRPAHCGELRRRRNAQTHLPPRHLLSPLRSAVSPAPALPLRPSFNWAAGPALRRRLHPRSQRALPGHAARLCSGGGGYGQRRAALSPGDLGA